MTTEALLSQDWLNVIVVGNLGCFPFAVLGGPQWCGCSQDETGEQNVLERIFQREHHTKLQHVND
jgi:hypothetical protein